MCTCYDRKHFLSSDACIIIVIIKNLYTLHFKGYRKHFDPEIMDKKVRSLNKKLEKACSLDSGVSQVKSGIDKPFPKLEDEENDRQTDTKSLINRNSIKITTPLSPSEVKRSQSLTPRRVEESKFEFPVKTNIS